MIIFGTLVENDHISKCFFFHLFDVFIFWAVRVVKERKLAQDDKKNLPVAVDISGTMHYMIVIYGTLV